MGLLPSVHVLLPTGTREGKTQSFVRPIECIVRKGEDHQGEEVGG